MWVLGSGVRNSISMGNGGFRRRTEEIIIKKTGVSRGTALSGCRRGWWVPN